MGKLLLSRLNMFFFADEDWVKSMMAKIDLNGDGGISVDEFVGLNLK